MGITLERNAYEEEITTSVKTVNTNGENNKDRTNRILRNKLEMVKIICILI